MIRPVAPPHHAAQRRAGQAEGGGQIDVETACQSSSFMRSARLSRVMPALLTRMSSWPSAASASSTSASAAARIGEIGGSDVGALAQFGGQRLERRRAGAGQHDRGALARAARARSRRRCRPRRRSPAPSCRSGRTSAAPQSALERRLRSRPARPTDSRRRARGRCAWPGRSAPCRRRSRRARRPRCCRQTAARSRASAPCRSPARPAAAGSPPGRWSARAVTLATSGTRGGCSVDLGQRLGHLVGGRRHQRRNGTAR